MKRFADIIKNAGPASFGAHTPTRFCSGGIDPKLSPTFFITHWLIVILLTVLCTACGENPVNEGENFGNLLTSASGLVLTQAEHPTGWGHSECTLCHNLENIHLIDRTGVTNIQVVHDQAIRDGITGCAACHGINGAP